MSNLSLEIGKRALLANKLGLDVTSNNIANVNTEGYTRRDVTFSETDPLYNRNNYLGTGLEIDKFRSFREEFFDRELRNTASRKEGYALDELVYQKIESFLNEPTDNGLNDSVSNLFNSVEEMNNSPENMGMRENFLSKAQILVDRFNTISDELTGLRTDAADKLGINVEKANGLLKDIASLNGSIASARSLSNGDVQTMDNQRTVKISELAKIVNVNVTADKFGQVNLNVNGMNLVTGTNVNELTVKDSKDAITGERTLSVYSLDADGNVINKIEPSSGEISSQLKHYNVTLDNLDSSGGFSLYKKLDDFADSIIKKFNTYSVQGFGLDDKGTTAPGRSIFEPAIGKGGAGSIEISSDIKDKPRNIPLSSAPDEPGNNAIGRKIANIQNDGTFLDGMTPANYYATLMGRVGTMGQESKNGTSTTSMVYDQLNNQRTSQVGVNVDEEAVNLIKFQKAFEAASRIINTTNELMNTVINLGR